METSPMKNEDELYTPKVFPMCPFGHEWYGLYTESIIMNHSGFPVVAIDRFGVVYDIVSRPGSKHETATIEIMLRKANGAEREQRSAGGNITERPVDGTRIEFEYWKLQRGPIYVREIDLLFCTKDSVGSATHPALRDAAVSSVVHSYVNRPFSDILPEVVRTPRLKLHANDSTGVLSELWVYMAGAYVPIDVTCIPDKSEDGITLILNQGREVVNRLRLHFDEVLTDEVCRLRNGAVYFFGRTKEEVQEKVRKDIELNKQLEVLPSAGKNFITMDEHRAVIKTMEEQQAARVDQIKADIQAEREAAKLEQKKLHNLLEEERQKLKEAELRENQWKTLYNTKMEAEKLEAQAEEAKEKARSAKQTSKTKWLDTIGGVFKNAAAVIGAVAAVATTVIGLITFVQKAKQQLAVV